MPKDWLDEKTYLQARTDERIWWRSRILGISRRQVLQLLAAGVGGGAIATLSKATKVVAQTTQTDKVEGIIKPAPSDYFYQKSTNLEMRWEQMYNRGYIVPNSLFFVRNNSPTPKIDASQWRLTVKGSGVSKPQLKINWIGDRYLALYTDEC